MALNIYENFRKNKLLCVILIIFYIILIIIIVKPGLFLYTDAVTSFPITDFMTQRESTWQNQAFLGYSSILITLPRIFYYLYLDTIYFIFRSTYLVQVLFYISILLFGHIGYYLFFEFNLKNKKVSYLLSILGMFNLFVVDRIQHPLILVGYFTLPYCLLYIQKTIIENKIKKNIIFFGLFSMILIVSNQVFYLFLIISLILFIYYLLDNKIELSKKAILALFFLMVFISLLLNSYFIIPFLNEKISNEPLANFKNNLETTIYYSEDSFIYNILSFTGFWDRPYKDISFFLLGTMSLSILIILSLFIKGELKWKLIFILGLLFTSVSTISLSLLSLFQKIIPYFSNITDTTYFLPLIIISSLLIIGNFFIKIKNKKIFILSFLLIFLYFSFSLISFYVKLEKDDVPIQYFKINKEIDDLNIERVWTIPDGWVQEFNWTKNGPYSGFFNSFVYPKEAFGQNTRELTEKYSFDYIRDFDERFINGSLSMEDLKIANIKHIIYFKQVSNFRIGDYYRDYNKDITSFENFLSDNKNYLQLVISNSYYSIYKISEKFVYPRIFSDYLLFQKINPTKYKIYINDLKEPQNLLFLESYHKSWNLYLARNPSSSWCKPIEFYNNTNTSECEHTQKFLEGEELSYLWETPIFDGTHNIVYDYANIWTIDPEYIKENYPKDHYKENPDGSIDVEMVLYFKPQSYFYLGLIISSVTLISCVAYLIYNWKMNKNRTGK